MQLDALINNLSAFSFEQEQQSIVHENLDLLSDMQKQQFAEGKDGKGEDILLLDNAKHGYGYRPFTIQQKQLFGEGLGRVTDRVTFFMTGELYSQVFARMNNNQFDIASHVEYWSTLIRRVQKEVNELNEDNRRFFGEKVIIPEISERIKDKVFNR